MNRRKFIAATGVGVGVAGCLTDQGPGEGEDASDDDGDATLEDGDDRGEGSPDSNDSATDGAEGDTDGNETDSDTEKSDADADGDDPEDEDGEEGDADTSERTTTFESCTRATVSGTFADGDVAYASTTFYQDGLVGDTLLEDGITFGDDVEAPFSGTVVFEIGDEAGVSEDGDEIVVTVPDYGNDGTAITGLTTERSDYQIGGITTPNPDADDCLAEIEPGDEGGDGSASESGVRVSITDATTPIDAGDSFEMTVRLENPGDSTATDDVALLVGNSRERVESRTVTLEGGERRTLSMGYETPPVANDQTFPVRVETSDDADERSVTVYGTE